MMAAGREPSPGPRPPGREGRPQELDACVHAPLSPTCFQVHGHACTRVHAHPLHARVLCWRPQCQQWAQLSHPISPTSSHAVGTLFFFLCLIRWFSSQTPHGSGFVFCWAFFFPPLDSSGAGERYHGSCAPPALGLFGVGAAACWVLDKGATEKHRGVEAGDRYQRAGPPLPACRRGLLRFPGAGAARALGQPGAGCTQPKVLPQLLCWVRASPRRAFRAHAGQWEAAGMGTSSQPNSSLARGSC